MGGGGRQRFAVRAEGQAGNGARMPSQEVKLLAGSGVPDGQLLGLAACQAAPVRTEGQALDRAGTAEAFSGRIETKLFLTGRRVPDADGLILRGGSQALAIRAEHLIADRTGVALDFPHRGG